MTNELSPEAKFSEAMDQATANPNPPTAESEHEAFAKEFLEGLDRDLGPSHRLEDAIPMIAQLPLSRFDQALPAIKAKYDVRTNTVDKLVKAARKAIVGVAEVEKVRQKGLLKNIEPWPEPVDGFEVMIDLVEALGELAVLPKGADITIALWTAFSHAQNCFEYSPYLTLSSPVKECGKTTVLRALRYLVDRPLPAANLTAPTLFRAMEEFEPTLIIDEGDSFIHDNEALRGVLDSGHEREMAVVPRLVGDDHKLTLFNTCGPKVIALIGTLHPTLWSRSIIIPMQKKLGFEKVARLKDKKPLLEELARKIKRWVADNEEAIRAANPTLPDSITNRTENNWFPLMAIASVLGKEWVEEAKWALDLIEKREADDDDKALLLIADIVGIFKTAEGESMWTSELITALIEVEDHPWSEWKNGKQITPAQLAKLLRPFGIVSKQVWKHGVKRNKQGYFAVQFADAFKRYVCAAPEDPRSTSELAKMTLVADPSQSKG